MTRLRLTYLGGFFLAIHYASVAYVNSSVLTQFVENTSLNLLYILGSILSVISLVFGPRLFKQYGSVATFVFFIILEIVAVFGMGSLQAAALVIILFLVHQAAESALNFCLDINLEHEIKSEGTTGSKRGILLTFQNLAWVLSPIALASLVSVGDFSKIYYLSGAALLPLLAITFFAFKDIRNPNIIPISFVAILHSLLRSKDNTRTVMVQFVLNFFYTWMVIYLPLLLSKDIGFAWNEIGILFTIMLLPFLLFELPAGFLADRKFGETEIMRAGFIIIGLSTAIIPLLKSPIFWVWAIVLFLTRTGASLVEISSESYFFKHVKSDDTDIISLFRMARPLSFIIAPLVAIPVIATLSYSASFMFLAIITLSGLLFIPKVDTK